MAYLDFAPAEGGALLLDRPALGTRSFTKPAELTPLEWQVVEIAQGDKLSSIRPAGRFVRKWGGTGSGPGKFSHAQAVAVAPDGSVYVSDLGNCRIEKFNSQGRFEAAWGSKGTGPGQFTHGPGQIGIGPGGLIYVTDYGANRIEEFRDTDLRAAQRWTPR